MTTDAWIDALVARHTASLTTAEFNRAVRALSARYVERRDALTSRSPIDSAGKRAAFAAFYAPLHFLTIREIIRALKPPRDPVEIVDLGCGTGTVSAAWSIECRGSAAMHGVDRDAWALAESRWNWSTLDLTGRPTRGDLVRTAETILRGPKPRRPRAWIAGWSINELESSPRDRLLDVLMSAADAGDSVLVVEPIARSATPWWDEWAAAFTASGGRADDWKFDTPLPPPLKAIDDGAGFSRDSLSARSLWR